MHFDEKIKAYTNTVCAQIRWKKAHQSIAEEIAGHISDQCDDYIKNGFDEAEAMEKAVKEMGDPVLAGSQLDRIHRPRIEWSMLGLTMLLLFSGIVINYFVRGNQESLSEGFYFYQTIQVSIIGCMGLLVAYFLDFSIIGKYPKSFYALFVMLITIIGHTTFNIINTQQWFLGGAFGLVPLPAFILLLPVAYAGVIYSVRNMGYLGILVCGIFYGIPAVIFLRFINGLSTIFLWSAVSFILLNYSINKGWFGVKKTFGHLIVSAPSVIFVIVHLQSMAYYGSRIKAILNPADYRLEAGYLPYTIREILAGARLLGQGTLPPWYEGDIAGYLPGMNINYILTYFIHRVGWISLIAVLAAALTFFARGIYLCSKHKSVLGKLVSMSVLLSILIQTLMYICGNLGYPLLAQFTLPLVSYGGTMNAINLIQIGILLSVFKSGSHPYDSQEQLVRKKKFWEIINGKLVINLKVFN